MTPHAAAGDLTYQQLFEECEARKDWERYRVTDPYVRALTGGTSIMYQASGEAQITHRRSLQASCVVPHVLFSRDDGMPQHEAASCVHAGS